MTARAVLIAFVALAAPAGAQDAERLERGRAVYARWCSHCHDPGREHPGTLAIAVKYDGARPGSLLEWTDLAPDLTVFVVRNGAFSMPPFRKTEISDAELADLAAYLARNAPATQGEESD